MFHPEGTVSTPSGFELDGQEGKPEICELLQALMVYIYLLEEKKMICAPVIASSNVSCNALDRRTRERRVHGLGTSLFMVGIILTVEVIKFIPALRLADHGEAVRFVKSSCESGTRRYDVGLGRSPLTLPDEAEPRGEEMEPRPLVTCT
jgi:hypothetical protein